MTLPILKVPDPRLRQVAAPVRGVDPGVVRLMENMLETMYAAPGIGLSAPQVGVLKRVLVADITGRGVRRDPLCMANPEILWASAESSFCNEGCLSLPDQYAAVSRPSRVLVRYLNRQNEVRDYTADGLLATVIQHEMDHLEGILFVDYLSKLRRDIIVRRLQKAHRLRLLGQPPP
ncbi:Peptide deformylase [invertebrate metagenome]|uniref:Peptide deformylase n=1 Tax=invertebrate metagenome TaxID=1711999 RepID=A0A484H6Y2_9ZZZZ